MLGTDLVYGGLAGHCSAHDQAAIRGERLAGERLGFVAGEHGHHSGGVVGCERPVQRHVRLGIGELGRRPGGAGGCASESRRDRGHRDAVAAELDRERPRHSDQRALRRDVGEHLTVWRAPERVRDDEDHAAEPAISHSGSERLREQQRRLYVDRLNLAPGVELDLLERPERERRRCVNEDVAPAVTIEDKFSGAAYVICVAQVDDDIAGAVEDDHGVVGCEARDDRAANSAGAAGHDRDSVILVGFARHQTALRSLGFSTRW